jgi:GMP synthase (glutamine-hydrolysing)
VKPILIVQHEPSVPPGLIASCAEDSGNRVRVLEAWREESWPAIEDLRALVVMGGTMNVDQLEEFPFLERSRALTTQAIESGVPTLGVCLGSQMMARVLGSEVRRAPDRNALFSTLELTEEGKKDPLSGPFDGVRVLQFHEDTFDVPDGAVPLATSSHSSLTQAFRYGKSAYAIQFHFEVDRRILEGWIESIGPQDMLEGWGREGSELLEQADRALAAQSTAGRRLVEGFIALT